MKNLKLAQMEADYGDVVPRRDYEKLDQRFQLLQKDIQKLKKDHNTLMKEHKWVTNFFFDVVRVNLLRLVIEHRHVFVAPF